MVRYITLEETLPVRSAVLRNHKPFSECYIPGDFEEGSMHIGYEEEGQIVGVASFYPQTLEDRVGKGFRLRLMGVLTAYHRRGIGAKILLEGIRIVKKEKGASYLWCNSRKVAYAFYEALGFVYISKEFEIPVIGPHRKMILEL